MRATERHPGVWNNSGGSESDCDGGRERRGLRQSRRVDRGLWPHGREKREVDAARHRQKKRGATEMGIKLQLSYTEAA